MTSVESAHGAYLDHGASTPILPEVFEAMLVHLRDHYANPSGVHHAGRGERRAIDDARDILGDVLGCSAGEIVFTSGGTEADNLAIFGVAQGLAPGAVIVSAIEHHGVLRPAEALGARIAPVNGQAVIDLRQLELMLDSSVGLVSMMAVNNEVGTVQPIGEVVSLVRSHAPDALVHCDAVQALQWYDLATLLREVDLLTISAHKIGGPKGVGALVVRDRARSRIHPLLLGGSQERDLRAGTENVAGIVGLAVAAQLTKDRQLLNTERIRAIRDRFVDQVLRSVPSARETVARELRHVGNAHLTFPGTVNEEFLMLLDQHGVAASAGSSCASGALEPSHVLLAMGLTPDEARSCIRFTLGASSTSHEIDHAITGVIAAHRQLMGDVVE